jgi:hypothetical protein
MTGGLSGVSLLMTTTVRTSAQVLAGVLLAVGLPDDLGVRARLVAGRRPLPARPAPMALLLPNGEARPTAMPWEWRAEKPRRSRCRRVRRLEALGRRIAVAQERGEVRADVDAEMLRDLLYGVFEYRLVHLMPTESRYIEAVLAIVFDGVR